MKLCFFESGQTFLTLDTTRHKNWQLFSFLKTSSVFAGPGHVEQLRLRICGTRGFARYNWVGGMVFVAKMVWRVEADTSQKFGQTSSLSVLSQIFSSFSRLDILETKLLFEQHLKTTNFESFSNIFHQWLWLKKATDSVVLVQDSSVFGDFEPDKHALRLWSHKPGDITPVVASWTFTLENGCARNWSKRIYQIYHSMGNCNDISCNYIHSVSE